MLELNKDNFEEEVLQADGLVVVDFWSPSCGPCKQLMPDVVKLAEKYSGKAKFCSLNIAGNRRLAIGQKVLGLPTVAFYKGGDRVAALTVEIDIKDVESKLTELL